MNAECEPQRTSGSVGGRAAPHPCHRAGLRAPAGIAPVTWRMARSCTMDATT
ncbi:hypothetical protein SXCC_02619 [Gluconacetobacter sp. SXCC-1]|nr:hypothetical protein SXCC_02619 [Gluconacetobacter sp. SXCC-1]